MHEHEKPAVLELDDGRHVELPDYIVGEARAVVRMALAIDEPIAGEIDAHRVRAIGRWGPAGEKDK